MEKKEQLINLRNIFVGFFKLSNKQFEVSVKANPDLLKVDITKFNETYAILHNGLKIKYDNVRRIIFSHPTLLFAGNELKTNIVETYEFLKTELDITPKTFSYIIVHNPRIITRPNKQNLSWINTLRRKVGLSDDFIRHLLGHAHNCQPVTRRHDEVANQYKYTLAFLDLLGFKKEDLTYYSEIITLSVSKLNRRYKLACINNYSPEQFLDFCHKIPVEVAYARTMGIENGLVDPSVSPYLKREDFEATSCTTDSELLQLFPYTRKAKNLIDDTFKTLNPELSDQINEFYMINFNVDKNSPKDDENELDEFEAMFLSEE